MFCSGGFGEKQWQRQALLHVKEPDEDIRKTKQTY